MNFLKYSNSTDFNFFSLKKVILVCELTTFTCLEANNI